MTVPQLRLWIGFLAALALSILPMPEMISAFRPPWVLLYVLYIGYFLPGNFKLISLLIAGLFLDVLLSTVIGEHSFALLFVTWLASTKARRFQFFSMIQQICLIGFFCLLYQFCIVFIDSLLGFNYKVYMPFTSTLMGMFIWPWIRILGDSSLFMRLVYR